MRRVRVARTIMPEMRYVVSYPKRESHLIEVTLTAKGLPRMPDGSVALTMAAWTPGSYLIRDYARHVQDLSMTDARGRALPWTRTDKQTWVVKAKGAATLIVKYRVYANDLGVRTSHLDATHCYMDGTSVFIHGRDAMDAPAVVTIRPPRGWTADSGVPRVPGKRSTFRVDDVYHLMDATWEVGTHRRFAFEVDGKEHRIALYGNGNEDPARIVRDLEAIVREEVATMGSAPYEDYQFIIHLTHKAGGGLEHRNSNTSMVDRWTFQPARRYEDFLGLEAHEFYHVWNVKRLRPAAFDRYDYSQEVYTRLLWAMEGITSYYDHLVLARAGLISHDRYREFLAESITKLRKQPGRLKLSVGDSSLLTWVKLYKADENWPNSGVSYYLKGELIALCLDLAIRDRTHGKKGLDHVMRALYAKYPEGAGGIPEHPENGWKQTLEEVTGQSWTTFWKKYVDGTDEVDFERFLKLVGWKLSPEYAGDDSDPAKGDYEGPGSRLGVKLKKENGRIKAKHVFSGTPAEAAGITPGDEIVALDGFRVKSSEHFMNRLREREPGSEVEVAFFRRDRLTVAKTELAPAEPKKWVITEVKRPNTAQKRLRRTWLAPHVPPVAEPVAGGRRPRTRQARALIEEKGE